MDWMPLLSSTLRLVDLHDSERTFGSSSPTVFTLNREIRPGHRDGVWLDVAITALEFLRDHERNVAGRFVPGTEIRNNILLRHPYLTAEDIAFVLSALAVPAELWFLERAATDNRSLRSTKDTNLVDKARGADAYRLTATGKLTTTLSTSIRELAYVAGAARNLLAALKIGEYLRVDEFADGLIDVLRTQQFQITAELERGRPGEAANFFLQHSSIIREQIADASTIVRDAKEYLSQSAAITSFENWREGLRSSAISPPTLSQLVNHIDRISQALIRLLDVFNELIRCTVSDQKAPLAAVSFARISLLWATNGEMDDLYQNIVARFGPRRYSTPLPCAFDLFGVVEADRVASELIAENREVGEPPALSKGLLFLECYRLEILRALDQGPLSLADALDRGWVELTGESLADVSALIGIFTAPELLGPEEQIGITLAPGAPLLKVSKAGICILDNLVMQRAEG